jgi:hypothetical protein
MDQYDCLNNKIKYFILILSVGWIWDGGQRALAGTGQHLCTDTDEDLPAQDQVDKRNRHP